VRLNATPGVTPAYSSSVSSGPKVFQQALCKEKTMATREEVAEWLYDGAVALRAGDRQRALDLLMQVVEIDEENEQAWLWLSGAVDNIDDQQIALENVLTLNPHNELARRGLEWIAAQKQRQGTR